MSDTRAMPAPPRPGVTQRAIGTARLLAGARDGRVDLATHREVHGQPQGRDLDHLWQDVSTVRMLGRGGAAFAVADKLAAVPRGRNTQVLVNGAEGEPASHKDRVLMRLAPHLVIDGALAVAGALETQRLTMVVQDRAAHASLNTALRERRDTRRVRLVGYDHGFVGGEIRAVVRTLSGGPAAPPGRRVLPSESGVEGRPTFASNVETFAQVGLLLCLGVEDYASVGSADEPGTTLLTLLGDVPRPGVIEVPTGLPVDALTGAGGPVLIGGYHGTWVADPRGLEVSRPALRAAGAPLNAGVLARLPDDTCALGEVATVAQWLAEESVGQCGPCFFGLPSLAAGLRDLAAGRNVLPLVERRAGLLPGRGACAHPDGSASFVRSALAAMPDEIETHRRHGHCGRPLLGALPVPATPVAAA